MQKTLLILAGIGAIACAPVLTVLAQDAPSAGNIGLVISKPWGNSAQKVANLSNLTEVGPLRGKLGVFVTIETENSVQTLYSNGAWLVVDGQKIMELCVS